MPSHPTGKRSLAPATELASPVSIAAAKLLGALNANGSEIVECTVSSDRASIDWRPEGADPVLPPIRHLLISRREAEATVREALRDPEATNLSTLPAKSFGVA